MCVIVDANLASAVFGNPPDDDFAPVFRWLHDGTKDGCLVAGGHLVRELLRTKARHYLAALQRAGRAILVPDATVSAEETCVLATGLCRSDDPHVVALARLSGARTLCSRDKALHAD